MQVFDAHIHIFPERIAAQTVAYLGAEAGIKPFYDGTRDGLLKSMTAAGINGALNCPIATKLEQVASINRWAVTQNEWPMLSLGTIHPDTPDPADILRGVKAAGLPGIKLHPEYQEFAVDEPRVVPIWGACADLGLVAMLHAGGDIAFAPPYGSDPKRIRQVVEAFPGLRLIAAHFGSWQMWEEVRSELLGAPVWIDTSFTLGEIPDEVFVEMVRSHGVERVLFGTDAPWRSQAEDLQHFLRLPFTVAEQEAMLWGNAAALLGFSEAS